MVIKTLADLLIEELKDLYHAEKQLTKALPKLAKAAQDEALRAAFTGHLKETEGQIQRLEQVFAALGVEAKAKKCEAMEGLVKEGQEVIDEGMEAPWNNAALIAAAQMAM